MRLILIALLGLTVTGSYGHSQVSQLANNTHKIRVPTLAPISGSPDPGVAAFAAKDAFPKGYTELSEELTRRVMPGLRDEDPVPARRS